MRAVTISGPGPSGKLSISSLNHPNAGQSDVVITVAAAGVNRADLLQRAGYYPPPANAPDWPGLEISGTVKRVGPGVSRWRAGDRVVALLEGGGYAEEVAVRETLFLGQSAFHFRMHPWQAPCNAQVELVVYPRMVKYG